MPKYTPPAAGNNVHKYEFSAYFPGNGYLRTVWDNSDNFGAWVTKSMKYPRTPDEMKVARTLMIHEDLHWKIQTYAYARAQQFLKTQPLGYAVWEVPVGGDRGKAIQEGIDEANKEREARMLKLYTEFKAVVQGIQDLYDAEDEANHGINGDRQKYWVQNYKFIVDAKLLEAGWRAPGQ